MPASKLVEENPLSSSAKAAESRQQRMAELPGLGALKKAQSPPLQPLLPGLLRAWAGPEEKKNSSPLPLHQDSVYPQGVGPSSGNMMGKGQGGPPASPPWSGCTPASSLSTSSSPHPQGLRKCQAIQAVSKEATSFPCSPGLTGWPRQPMNEGAAPTLTWQWVCPHTSLRPAVSHTGRPQQ